MQYTDKKALRRVMLQRRNAMSGEARLAADKYLRDKIAALATSRSARVIHCYLPMADEPDLWPLISRWLSEGISIVCPKVDTGEMLKHLVLRNTEQLNRGPLGTTHPLGSEEYRGHYDMIIVPGLAFDRKNHRLGYGKGYYDRFLIDHPDELKVALAYAFQWVDVLPAESHDVALDLVITAPPGTSSPRLPG